MAGVTSVVSAVLAAYFFAMAIEKLSLGSAYLVFVGIAAIGTFAFEVVYLEEAMNLMKLLGITLILIGTAILSL